MSDTAHIDYFNMGPRPLYCGFTTSRKAFRKEMKRLAVSPLPDFHGSTHANATTHFLHAKDGGFTTIITLDKPKGRTPEQIAGLIAHEATHVAQELWTNIGEREPGKEAEAYLVQAIVQNCLQVAMKTGRVRKTEP